jgi:cytochrome c oxidase subunit 3
MAAGINRATTSLQGVGVQSRPQGNAGGRPERSETGVWIGIFSIVMSFAAITSAMIVRQGASNDWMHFALPRILYLNTVLIFASSVTLSFGERQLGIAAGIPVDDPHRSSRFFDNGMTWLYVTLALGVLFVFGQVLGWRILSARGLFLSTNPSSSFFYVFTAMHGLHLIGGIVALCYMLYKLGKTKGTARTTGLRACSLYWHFMDVLWIYLLCVLVART